MALSAKTSTEERAPDDLEGMNYPVAVVGGGQAGLSMIYWLTQRGIDHVVLERDRIGQEWRERRWDSFCLVTPNWQCQLPGFPYSDHDPDGFMARDEIVRYIEATRNPSTPRSSKVSRPPGCAVIERAGTWSVPAAAN